MKYEVYDEVLQMNTAQRRWLMHHVMRLRDIDAALLQNCQCWAQAVMKKEQLRHSSLAAISQGMFVSDALVSTTLQTRVGVLDATWQGRDQCLM